MLYAQQDQDGKSYCRHENPLLATHGRKPFNCLIAPTLSNHCYRHAGLCLQGTFEKGECWETGNSIPSAIGWTAPWARGVRGRSPGAAAASTSRASAAVGISIREYSYCVIGGSVM